MVSTPLHYVHAYTVYRASKKKLRLSYLVIGCIVPDIEIPILYLLGYPYPFDRLVLHSLIGSILFSWAVGLVLLPLYWRILRLLGLKFSHQINFGDYVAGVIISSEIHVIIDSAHHPYNPSLWPVTSQSIDNLILFGDWLQASNLMQILFLAALILILEYEAGIRDLVNSIVKLKLEDKGIY